MNEGHNEQLLLPSEDDFRTLDLPFTEYDIKPQIINPAQELQITYFHPDPIEEQKTYLCTEGCGLYLY